MKFILAGPPIAKKRHKCGCRGKMPIAYDPQLKEEMRVIKAQMLSAWKDAYHSSDREMAMEATNLTKSQSFSVSFIFAFPVNASETAAQKNAKLWGFHPHNVKPDFDNLAKLYADCATGILWSDDCQVTFSSQSKFYDENPRTEIEIMVNKDFSLCDNAEGVLSVFSPTKLRSFLEDVEVFRSWNPSVVDELVAMGSRTDKGPALTVLTDMLAIFAMNYGNELKKIQKYYYTPEPNNKETNVQTL